MQKIKLTAILTATILITSVLAATWGLLLMTPQEASASPGKVAMAISGLAAGREIIITGKPGTGSITCGTDLLGVETQAIVLGAGNQSRQGIFSDIAYKPGTKLQITGGGSACSGNGAYFVYNVQAI